MATIMFPGQGSQIKGMGAQVFAKAPKELTIAEDLLGYSLEELCLHDPKQQLNKTEFTQPALFVVESLTYQLEYAKTAKPDYFIGHSLGEYAALYAAGVFDFVTGLKLIKKRAELFAQATGGSMLAVLGLPSEIIKMLLQENNFDSIDFANFNSSQQLILSGPSEDIEKARALLADKAKRCIPLLVSGAFHSRYMTQAASQFQQFINSFHFAKLQTPVIANITAQPYTDENIKDNLVKQIAGPVHWDQTIRYLKERGETEFIEVGPGTVLTRLVKQN